MDHDWSVTAAGPRLSHLDTRIDQASNAGWGGLKPLSRNTVLRFLWEEMPG